MSHKLLYVGMALVCLLGAQVRSHASDSVDPASVQQTADITVKGKVVDTKGEPVVGASVVASSTNGVVTDLDGRYSINVPGDAVLTVSSIGYTSVEVSVSFRAVIDVTLTEDVEFIDEVVVVGLSLIHI